MKADRQAVDVSTSGVDGAISVSRSSGSVWSTLRQPPVLQRPESLEMPTQVTHKLPLDSYRSYLMGLARVLLASAGRCATG